MTGLRQSLSFASRSEKFIAFIKTKGEFKASNSSSNIFLFFFLFLEIKEGNELFYHFFCIRGVGVFRGARVDRGLLGRFFQKKNSRARPGVVFAARIVHVLGSQRRSVLARFLSFSFNSTKWWVATHEREPSRPCAIASDALSSNLPC